MVLNFFIALWKLSKVTDLNKNLTNDYVLKNYFLEHTDGRKAVILSLRNLHLHSFVGKGKLTTASWDKDISRFPKASFCETFWCFQMQCVCLRKTNISSPVDTRFQYTPTP